MADPSPADIPVKSRKRQLVLNLLFTYTNIGLLFVQGFVLTPFYFRFISADLYGAWMATGNILAWIQLIDPGLNKVLQQRVAYAFGARDYDGLPATIGTGLLLGFFLAMGPLLVIPWSGAIAGMISLSPTETAELGRAVMWGLVSTGLVLASFQPAAANLSLQMTTATGVIYLLGAVLNIAVTVGLLVGGFGLSALPLGLAARGAVLLGGNLALLQWWMRRRLRRRMTASGAELRNYGTLISVTFTERIGSTLIQNLEPFLAARLISPADAAAYTITSRAFEPTRLASERMGPVMLPGLAHLVGEGRRDRVAEVSSRLLHAAVYAASVGAACTAALNVAFVPLWMKRPELFAGQGVTVALAAALVTNVLFGITYDTVFALGGIRATAVVRLCEGVARLVAQMLLTWRFGLVGLALGGAAGTLVVCGFALPRLMARYLEKRRLDRYRMVGAILARCAALLALGACGYFLFRSMHWTWPRFALAATATAAALGGAGLLIHQPIRQEARAIWTRLSARLGGR